MALEMVRLTGFEKRKPHQLSGGQQQRVALARALVLRPRVLLLDEPLGALDAKLRKQLQLELAALQKDVGITFVYVTHDQEEALTMSDRLVVMDQGRIAQCGTPREVYEEPADAYVADFLGVANLLPARYVTPGRIEVAGTTLAVDHPSASLERRPAPAARPTRARPPVRRRFGRPEHPARHGGARRVRRGRSPRCSCGSTTDRASRPCWPTTVTARCRWAAAAWRCSWRRQPCG